MRHRADMGSIFPEPAGQSEARVTSCSQSVVDRDQKPYFVFGHRSLFEGAADRDDRKEEEPRHKEAAHKDAPA